VDFPALFLSENHMTSTYRAKKKETFKARQRVRRKVRTMLGLPKNGSRQAIKDALVERGFARIDGEGWEIMLARFCGIDISKELAEICQKYREIKHPDPPKTKPPVAPKPAREFRPLLPKHPTYKRDEDFYISREWRELRYLALKNTEGRCQCCGASSKDGVRIHVDHIQPRYHRPDLSLSLDNLQVLCEDCNYGKGAWDNTDWR
jgi:hypothetical protein